MTRDRLIFCLLLALICLAFEAGRVSAHHPAPRPPAQTASANAAASVAPLATFSELATEAPDLGATVVPLAVASPRPVAVSVVRPPRLVRGIASWGDGWAGVVTRLPRGTWIRVCGALGCWSGRSVGFGPAVATGRIADRSAAVFAAICGAPSMGLCSITLERL
jgi:hypothetical protein